MGSNAHAGKVFIANHHHSPIALPRRGDNGIALPAVILPPGTSTPLDADHWGKVSQMSTVKLYIEKELLSKIKKEVKKVAVNEDSGADPVVPEHLQTAEEEGIQKDTETGKGAGKAKAKVKKAEKGEVTV